jgi:hypothetical protein
MGAQSVRQPPDLPDRRPRRQRKIIGRYDVVVGKGAVLALEEEDVIPPRNDRVELVFQNPCTARSKALPLRGCLAKNCPKERSKIS